MVDEESGALRVSIPPLGGTLCCFPERIRGEARGRDVDKTLCWDPNIKHEAWHAFYGTDLASVPLTGLSGHPKVQRLPLDPGDSRHCGGPPV